MHFEKQSQDSLYYRQAFYVNVPQHPCLLQAGFDDLDGLRK